MAKLLIPRRKFLLGLGAALAAPAIVRIENIMPIFVRDKRRETYWIVYDMTTGSVRNYRGTLING